MLSSISHLKKLIDLPDDQRAKKVKSLSNWSLFNFVVFIGVLTQQHWLAQLIEKIPFLTANISGHGWVTFIWVVNLCSVVSRNGYMQALLLVDKMQAMSSQGDSSNK